MLDITKLTRIQLAAWMTFHLFWADAVKALAED